MAAIVAGGAHYFLGVVSPPEPDQFIGELMGTWNIIGAV